MKLQENHNASPPSVKHLAALKFQLCSVIPLFSILLNNQAHLLEVRRFSIYGAVTLVKNNVKNVSWVLLRAQIFSMRQFFIKGFLIKEKNV